MIYRGRAAGAETELSVEREGLRLGRRFLDYADLLSIRPVSHRVLLGTCADGELEIAMLGFSYDGFLEELTEAYGARSQEALFVDETQLMLCEGEYELPGARGRGKIALYPDAVCVLPPDCRALRIPLCFTEQLRLEGYRLSIVMRGGAAYAVGKMGYDTKPFAERAQRAAELVKAQRRRALEQAPLSAPFTEKGLFRTRTPEQYWTAAFGAAGCAVELFTGEDAATYLYRLREDRSVFLRNLEEAMEAMGTHREIIYWSDAQLAESSLYRMSVERSAAVRFLRERSDGRLIHSANHARRLQDYLGLQEA